MTAAPEASARRARPCPFCELQAKGDDVVVGLYTETRFQGHVAAEHPGYDWRTGWAMPMPPAPPPRRAER